MKLSEINFKTLLPVAAIAFASVATSCVGDLDVDPTIDKSTIMTFDRDGNFRKIYANMALTGQVGPAGDDNTKDIADIDEGTSNFFRQLWNMNELPTDEAICSWGDPGIPEYNFATWSASHGMMTGEYYRLFFGITLANNFLTQTEGDNSTEAVAERAEARFLRALYYAYAIDLFGNVPFMTELMNENPPQGSRSEVFDFCIKELEECATDLAAPKQATYGRADQAAAWMLMARLYLNAEVYTGTAQWAKAAEYAKKVMDSGYSLCPNYSYLFMGDNDKNGAQNEIILPILQDGIQTQSYGGMQFVVCSTYDGDMPSHGTSEVWAGNRARKELVLKFFPNGNVPENAESEAMQDAANDDRAMFYSVGHSLDIEKTTQFKEGIAIVKFTGAYSTGATPTDPKFVDTDVPFIRLAEAYLTYAEAQARLGNAAEAKTAIDALKDRAHANKQPSYSLNDICDEWAREFYFEGRRRMDLVRFDKFGGRSDYVWAWKGGVQNGTNFDAERNVYPIPDNEMGVNTNLTQNPGY